MASPHRVRRSGDGVGWDKRFAQLVTMLRTPPREVISYSVRECGLGGTRNQNMPTA